MPRFWLQVRQWLAQVGEDLRTSTDSGLLAVARFFGLLYGPIDATVPLNEALRKSLRYRLAPHVGWRHALGGVTYLLFLVMVVTGVLLAVYYRPSAQEAFQSVQHVVSGVTFGWLIRDLHVWGASLLVVAMLAHMGRVFFEGAYKPPRETNWLIGILLLFVVLVFGATGYLLPWDQTAYWTVTEGLSAVEGIPLFGGILVGVLRSDPIVSGATLSRFFAIHVVVLPWLALMGLILHFMMMRRHGVAPPVDGAVPAGPGRQFFPNHLLRSFMVGIMVLAVIVTLAVLFPRPIGVPAQPGELPDRLIPTWVVVDVSRGLAHHLGALGFTLFTLLGVALALLPLFDRGPERHLRRRPVAAVIGLTFFIGFAGFWLAGRALRTVSAPPVPAAETPAPAPAAPPADTAAGGAP